MDWLFEAPWWIVVGLAITVILALLRVGRWTGSVDKEFDSIKDRLSSLENLVGEVNREIKKIFQLLPNPTAAGESPVKLTDFGREVAATMQVSVWVAQHAPDLDAQAQEKEEFEIFDLCVEYVNQAFDKDTELQKKVRSEAYQHATDQGNILRVYHVMLRDAVLNRLRGQRV